MSYPDDVYFDTEWSEPRAYARSLKPVRTVAPAAQPVTQEELKLHCRVDHNDDNGTLDAVLAAAIDQLDGYAGILGRALITQTWRLDLSYFSDVMRLPLEPLGTVSSITYYDSNDAQQTLSASIYGVYTDARGPYVALKFGYSWPTTFEREDAISITFTAGYGTAATDVPSRLRQAIKLHAAYLYKYREMDAPSDYTETDTYKALIKPFVRVY